MQVPRTKFNNLPYSDSFTDIDKNNTILQIGNTDYYEDVFKSINDYTYIETICELVPKFSFNKVEISMKYRNEIDEEINSIIKYNLYDNNIIKINNIVSSIDILLYDIINIPNNINNYLIYTKKFGIQNKNIILQTYEEEIESGINTTSNAYLLGGSFMPNNIQQYLFYIKHNYNEEPYINVISSEDVLNNNNIILDPNVKLEDFSTLQDDITNGKIIIDINNRKYKSLLYKKHTLISNKVNIIFKCINENT